jgi:hypothetical protein
MKGFFFFESSPRDRHRSIAEMAIPFLLNPFRVSIDISGFTPGCTGGYSYFTAFAVINLPILNPYQFQRQTKYFQFLRQLITNISYATFTSVVSYFSTGIMTIILIEIFYGNIWSQKKSEKKHKNICLYNKSILCL